MPGGRPVKYKTPEEMQVIIDNFFVQCIDDELHPTVTGLALALDLTREGLINYENKDDTGFYDTVKKAKLRVEAHIEQRLYHNNATGCIFNLKNNFGWKDKTEQEMSGGLEIKGIDVAIIKSTDTDT